MDLADASSIAFSPAGAQAHGATPASPAKAPFSDDGQELITRMRGYLPDDDLEVVRKAFIYGREAHSHQFRDSGEPYFIHCVQAANILITLKLDPQSIAAMLLHDVVEDTDVTIEQLRGTFGPEISALVDGVTKLSRLEDQSKEDAQAGTYRKMFIAMADDPRVVLIKLADRLHNLRTLGALSPERQRRIARETLDIYAPLAHRLGIWQFKWELEDLAFRYLDPEKYKEIGHQLQMRREAREKVILRVITRLKQTLEKEGIEAEITGRPKHIYSIYKKMERKQVSLDQIYDQLAVRVIVNSVGECYRVLGIVHSIWPPVLSEFDDYIAVPKESMYRSLHTTVLVPGGQPCEIQIRTWDMHDVAEHGIAAHWRYKEGFGRSDQTSEAKLAWLRSLIEWRREFADAHEFVEALKADVLEEQVYVFTPKGRIIDLPEGSTAVDFAYRIHSEVGNSCTGAKVNGRQVALHTPLQNGDIVQIVTSKTPRGPSRDWMEFVKTSNARQHIRRWFKRDLREENIAAGRDLLEKELKRLGLTVSFDEIATVNGMNGMKSAEDLFLHLGSGDLTARQAAHKLLSQRKAIEDPLAALPQVSQPSRKQPQSPVLVRGEDGLYTRLSRCCNPVQGEPIIGYITQGKGISIHRTNCHNVINERNTERLIEVTWANQRTQQSYPVPVRVEAWDRVGLWRDITNIIADAGINIREVQQVPNKKHGRTTLLTIVEAESLNQLTMLLDKLNRIPDVIEARRESGAYTTATL
jgi:GTP diphosphokinase / guanosine-3',5'-bis(diphosphate) 3'-diphosphatase